MHAKEILIMTATQIHDVICAAQNCGAHHDFASFRVCDVHGIAVPKLCINDRVTFNLRRLITENNENRRIVQVIGDSLPNFLPTLSHSIKKHIFNALADTECSIVLYGASGIRDESGNVDTNQILNDWIDENPDRRSRRVWGLLTDKGSIQAINEFQYTVSSNCKNFIVTTGNASFGDDVKLSDQLTDLAILIDGGVQSFEQSVNILLRPGTHIHAVMNARATKEKFSGARLLYELSITPVMDSENYCQQFTGLSSDQRLRIKRAVDQLVLSNFAERITYYTVPTAGSSQYHIT